MFKFCSFRRLISDTYVEMSTVVCPCLGNPGILIDRMTLDIVFSSRIVGQLLNTDKWLDEVQV